MKNKERLTVLEDLLPLLANMAIDVKNRLRIRSIDGIQILVTALRTVPLTESMKQSAAMAIRRLQIKGKRGALLN